MRHPKIIVRAVRTNPEIRPTSLAGLAPTRQTIEQIRGTALVTVSIRHAPSIPNPHRHATSTSIRRTHRARRIGIAPGREGALLIAMQPATASLTACALLLFAGPAIPTTAAQTASPAAATAPAARERLLFDGKSLSGWAITDFAGHGEVHVSKGAIVLGQGYMTGITWTNSLPASNYELSLEARRVSGSDFFCGLTFPIAGTNVSLIVGGWGGGVVGISSIDGNDASSNETTKFMSFEKDRWYAVRVRVTDKKLEAWIDKDKIIDLATAGKSLGLRSGPIEESVPLGVATYETQAELRAIRITELPPP